MDPINNEQIYDVTMEDNEQTTTETIQTAMVAGDFSQFNKPSPQNNNKTNSNDTSAKTDMNQDNE